MIVSNQAELEALFAAMHNNRVTHFQCGDIVIDMAPLDASINPPKSSSFVDPSAPVLGSDPIKHKVEQLESLMKLSDIDLVDKLFPEAEESKEGVA